MEIKDGGEAKVSGATHRYSILNPPEMVRSTECISAFFWGEGPRPPTLPHTVKSLTYGLMLFPAECQREVQNGPCSTPNSQRVSVAASLSLPWSQAPRAIRGSPQALEIQGGLSLLQDPVAPQAPWSRSCRAHQACQLFPSLLPGPSVLKVRGHPARTGSDSPALPSTTKSSS